jgi:hypothetical protein
VPTIISIHGTYASKPKEEGDQWWQRGSYFERHLRECVETDGGTLSFQPLMWDGKNEESSRLRAAKELVERCKALEGSGERYFLIGHSHGGSIISNALLLANEAKLSLPNMLKAITVGTPFIHITKANMLSRILEPVLLLIVLLVSLYAAVLSATTPGAFLNRQLVRLDPAYAREAAPLIRPLSLSEHFQDPSLPNLKLDRSNLLLDRKPSALDIISKTFDVVAFLACILVIKLLYNEFVAHRAISRANVYETGKLYASRWLGFACGVDEAIGGLSGIVSIKPVSLFFKLKIAQKSSQLTSILSAMLFLVLVFLGVVWVVLFSAASNLQPALSYNFISAFISAAVEMPGKAGKIGFVVAVIFVAALLVALAVCAVMAVTAAWAVGQFDQLLQRKVLGLDIPGQRATAVSSKPMWSPKAPIDMPADLIQQLTIFDDTQFGGTLRRELHTSLGGLAFPDFSQLMKAFTLTHQTYFSSPLFRKLIFAVLAEQPGWRATRVFTADPDHNRLRQWLETSHALAN